MKLLPRKKSQQVTGGTGRTPSRGVFSYYASRSSDTATTGRAGQVAPQASEKKWWHHVPTFVAAAAVLISLGYILKLDTNPKISLATQRGITLHSSYAYQQAAANFLRRSWFNRNKLTIDTSSVERALKQQFPELNEVAVTLPLIGHRPVVELAIVQPVLVMSNSSGSFVIAGNGKAVAYTADVAQPILRGLPAIQDKSGLSVQIGQTILPTAQVSFIQALTAQLKAQVLPVDSLTLPAVPNEIDVRIKGLAYYIKCNTLLDARQQVGTFLAAKQKLQRDGIIPAQYMDVRVEEKVFYK